MPNLKIVLFNPQIHWNTGAIGRTCVAVDAELIIIHPCGFDFDEREIKRAGLDYWQFLNIKHYDSWDDFLKKEEPQSLFFLSTKGKKLHYDAEFKEGSYLVFGSETSGLPEEIHNKYSDDMFKMPMFSENIRSLNLANTATAVIYEAIRKISYK